TKRRATALSPRGGTYLVTSRQLSSAGALSGEQGADVVDGVRLGCRLVVSVSADASEPEGHATRVPVGDLHAVDSDLHDLFGAQLDHVAVAGVLQLEEALRLPRQHGVRHPFERLAHHHEPTGRVACA